MNTAYLMDCMEAMKRMPDNAFDLAVVDPIYGDVTKGGYITGKSAGGVGPHPKHNSAMWEQPKTGKEYFDESDPKRPELLKNFRLAVAYDHNGIVFHQPLGIFMENVQRGYIAQVSEEAERALEGQK